MLDKRTWIRYTSDQHKTAIAVNRKSSVCTRDREASLALKARSQAAHMNGPASCHRKRRSCGK